MVIKAKEGRGVDRGKTLDIVVNQSLAEIPRINIFTHPLQTSTGKHCHHHLYGQLCTVNNMHIQIRESTLILEINNEELHMSERTIVPRRVISISSNTNVCQTNQNSQFKLSIHFQNSTPHLQQTITKERYVIYEQPFKSPSSSPKERKHCKRHNGPRILTQKIDT